jgi:hypothetical protein
MMNTTMQMMEMHSKDMPMHGMNMSLMQECIEACSACEQACTMCAGSMGADMAKCAAMCMDTADMSNTMMRMMMRPNGMHMESMLAMLQAMVVMSTACAEECMTHADMSDDCKMCAEVCRQCAVACETIMDSMEMAAQS